MNLPWCSRLPGWRAVICLALIGMLLGAGMARAEAQDAAKVVTVPLIPRGVEICVEATINDKPVLLCLDTGASGIALTEKAVKRLNLPLENKQVNVNGVGNETVKVSIVKIGKLGVGVSTLKAQSAFVIPLPEWDEIDGLLGTPFFQAWIVQMDYTKLQMTLTPRSDFKPPADATAFPIRFDGGIPALEATIDGIKGWFEMDTGAGDAVTLFGPFVKKHHLNDKYMPSLRTVTGEGIGGLTYGDLVRLPEFSMSSFHLTRVTAELSRQTGGAYVDKVRAGILGSEIWRRFVLTLDYQDKKIFLARNTQYDEPFLANRAGFSLDVSPALVQAVIPGSPAAEAGIQEGDVVLAIDGKPIDQIKFWEVGAIFRGEVGKKIVLHLRAKDKTERDATLILRDLY